MTERSKNEYQNLINRLKLPENKELYDEYNLRPNNSKESAEIWNAMRKIHGTYEKIKWGCDNSVLEEESLLRLIKEAHQLLDQSGWAKEQRRNTQ